MDSQLAYAAANAWHQIAYRHRNLGVLATLWTAFAIYLSQWVTVDTLIALQEPMRMSAVAAAIVAVMFFALAWRARGKREQFLALLR
jgi:hypothetical protein